MNKIFLILIFYLVSSSVFGQETQRNETLNLKSSNNCINKKRIEIKAFEIDKGWGFDILINGKVYIHQINIPAISGSKTFKTKINALKIAEIMKQKICDNILPPTITKDDLDKLITKNQKHTHE
jgi:hypothetical protein